MHNDDETRRRSDRRENWWIRYHRIAAITETLGRLPRRGDAGVDPADVSWLANQRRTNTLTPDKLEALTRIGWSDNPRQDHWEARCEQLRTFINKYARAPHVGGALPGESAIAHWYSRQRIAISKGTLSRDRQRALDYATRPLRH